MQKDNGKALNIKGCIFDYGGTLDTAGCHWGKVLWHAYRQCGIPVTEDQFREAYVHGERTLAITPVIKPDYTFYKTIEAKLHIEMELLLTKNYWNVSEQEYRQKHQEVLDWVYSGVKKQTAHSKQVLESISKKYPMVLVSNFYGNVGVVLQEFQFDRLFSHIVESAVVGIRKPDPRIFKLGVEALGMEAEDTVVVGDSFYKDITPAQKIGCQTVWFKGEGWTDEQYDESLPDAIITDLQQLLTLL